MRNQAVFQYHFTTDGTPRFDRHWQKLSEDDFHDRSEPLESLAGAVAPAPIWAQDLLRVARAVFLVDRRSPRRLALDGWTRTLGLSVQVTEPERWRDQQKTELNALLQVLTGDVWDVDVHRGARPLQALDFEPSVTDVALFSGGLDSTAHAAHIASHAGGSVLFIGYDWHLQARQRLVFESIAKLTRARSMCLRQVRLKPKALNRRLDVTNRSRSLLFMATAVSVAAAHRVVRVDVPENGQLAINPPLTAGRLSACSTRSVHPWILHMLNLLIDGVGGTVTVHNPLLSLTKGEVCSLALAAGLEPATLEQTVSCGHPTTAREGGHAEYHCGHCFPCLVRRSGLHTVLPKDHSGYRTALTDLDLFDPKDTKAVDLRDLIQWLSADFSVRDLIADVPFPPDTPPDAVMSVLTRGRQELAAMVEDLTYHRTPFRKVASASSLSLLSSTMSETAWRSPS